VILKFTVNSKVYGFTCATTMLDLNGLTTSPPTYV
jgi:hypothetical protein